MEPGTVFPPPHKPSEDEAACKTAAGLVREATVLSFIDGIQRNLIDPEFWGIFVFMNIAAIIFFRRFSPIIIFAAAFVMNIIHRNVGDISHIFYFGKSDKQARLEFDLKAAYNKAVLAEKSGNYKEAADLYEKFLKADKTNIQVRFSLARLYHDKLEKKEWAKRHYRILIQQDESHPLQGEAREALRTLA